MVNAVKPDAVNPDAVNPDAVNPDGVRFKVAAPPAVEIDASTEVPLLTVVELLLKNQGGLDRLLKTPERQRELLPKFLSIALACFGVYGVVMTGVLNGFFWQGDYWLAHLPVARAGEWSVANLTAAYALGLIAANGICLPSFYFYGLLAGLRTTVLTVAAHAIKAMACGGLALVGLLPVYLAIALTALIVPPSRGIGYPALTLTGLVLPFVAGFYGAVSLNRGLRGLADTMAPARRAQRECLLGRMVLAWIGVFTFVTPVVIYSLWNLLGHVTAS
jgi:hypothetical protein